MIQREISIASTLRDIFRLRAELHEIEKPNEIYFGNESIYQH